MGVDGVQNAIRSLLTQIEGNFSIYELTAGSLNLSATHNFTIENPAYYLTNFTDYSSINITDFYTLDHPDFQYIFLHKEDFSGGVVSLCFVLSGVVTASWMLFLLLLLSANTIPNTLILANSFYSVCHTVILAKLTRILMHQVKKNFSDTEQVQKIVTFSTAIIIVKCIATFFIYISWTDLLIQMNKYENRKRSLISGFCLSFVCTAFQLAYGLLFSSDDHTSKQFIAVKVIHFFLDILIQFIFQYNILLYSFRKKKFAYHKRALSLAVFSWMIFFVPYIFMIIDIVSDNLRTWSTYMAMFSKLCVSVVAWEWLHTIKLLEVKNGRKTVLGRRLSNDSFTTKMISDDSSENIYLMRSLNIVALFSSLKRKLVQACTSKKKDDTVSMYEMVPTMSRQSLVSGPSAVSLVGDYPQFNVDQRYLRNTPSTHRNTPMSPTED